MIYSKVSIEVIKNSDKVHKDKTYEKQRSNTNCVLDLFIYIINIKAFSI